MTNTIAFHQEQANNNNESAGLGISGTVLDYRRVVECMRKIERVLGQGDFGD